MTVTTEATNHSDGAAPFGVGFHPYLTVGTPSVDSARLMIPAKQRLVADERALPVGAAQLAGTEFDFVDDAADRIDQTGHRLHRSGSGR